MTTLQEFTAIKLAVAHSLPFEEARQIVADEVHSWQLAQIPFGWSQDITKATDKQKRQAWYSVGQKYREVEREKDRQASQAPQPVETVRAATKPKAARPRKPAKKEYFWSGPRGTLRLGRRP